MGINVERHREPPSKTCLRCAVILIAEIKGTGNDDILKSIAVKTDPIMEGASDAKFVDLEDEILQLASRFSQISVDEGLGPYNP